MDSQANPESRVPAHDSESPRERSESSSERSEPPRARPDIPNNTLTLDRLKHWIRVIEDPDSQIHDLRLEFYSPGGSHPLSRDQPNFLHFTQVIRNFPLFSRLELLQNPRINGKRRLAFMRCPDNKVRLILVRIYTWYGERTRFLNERIFVPVDAESLDLEPCCICCWDYSDGVIRKGDGLDHVALKLAKCGHVFGRICITKWLEMNDACPICRDELALPMPYKLRAEVEWP